MKKCVVSVFLFLLFSMNAHALEYSCSINSEKDYIAHYNDKLNDEDLYTSINIDITNIENIDSFRLYAKYDNKKYEVKTCHFLNYNTSGCSLAYNNDSLIFYDYKYSNVYKLRDYPFFYINFLSNKSTPSKGNTKVEVYFEDAKDKDGKNISIKSCSKTFNFKEVEIDESVDINNKVNVKDINVTIDDYDFKFDKDIYNYDIKVDKDINSLNVNVLVSDDYKYTLSGASDLNSYGNKVTITLLDSDNNEKVYVINVIKEKSDIKQTDIKKDIKNTIKSVNYRKYIPYIAIILVSLVLLIIIIKKITSRKIDKYLDKL